MKVTFQNSMGIERVLAEVSTYKECRKVIKDFLEDHNYKSYYTRVEKGKDYLKFDVGSWSEFFFLYGTEQEIADALKED